MMRAMRDKIATAVFLAVIRFYKKYLTQYTPKCPHKPTCSTYAYNAIRDYGPVLGLDMAVKNIQSCSARYRQRKAHDSQRVSTDQADADGGSVRQRD